MQDRRELPSAIRHGTLGQEVGSQLLQMLREAPPSWCDAFFSLSTAAIQSFPGMEQGTESFFRPLLSPRPCCMDDTESIQLMLLTPPIVVLL